MKSLKIILPLLSLPLVLTSRALAGGEELDVEVGVTPGGQLAFPAFDFGVVTLDAIDPGNPLGLIGYLGEDPGWAAEGAPEGLLALADGADVHVQVLSLSPALRMLDPNSGLNDIVAGGTWRLGGPEFDGHPLWFIDREHPAYHPDAGSWVVTWRLIDLGTTQYAASSAQSFAFVPEPSALLLLGWGAVALGARRHRRREVR